MLLTGRRKSDAQTIQIFIELNRTIYLRLEADFDDRSFGALS